MDRVSEFLNRVLGHYEAYPLFIKIAVGMILFSITMVILVNLGIILRRTFSAINELRLTKAKNRLTDELSVSLVGIDMSHDKDVNRLSNRLSNVYLRDQQLSQLIMDQLIFFRRNFSDTVGQAVYLIFNKLELVQRSLKKLKMPSWDKKAEALREIQEMPPEEVGFEILEPYIINKNDDLRIEAQAAYIRLNKPAPFAFLHDATEPMPEWHQIILFETALNTEDLVVPQFKEFFGNPEPTVLVFCIKMIEQHHQLDAIPALIRLLDNASVKVKLQVIHALGKLDAEEAEEKFKDIFNEQELQVRVKIIEVIGKIASGEQLDFLKDQFLISQEFEIISASSCA
ncbi:MAG: HEAT repeat domain-containing protein, partial [Pedobacter sp.]